MNNLAASIIGLHDPVAHTIQFNANFIGKMNVSFAAKHDSVTMWYVTLKFYAESGGATYELVDGGDYCNINSNGLLTYDPTKLEDSVYHINSQSSVVIKPYYTNIAVHCKAYSPDLDDYESLTFNFRYGQISV